MTKKVLGKNLVTEIQAEVWEADFYAGTNEPSSGDKVYTTSDDYWVVVESTVTSGTWAGNDAAGTLTVRKPDDSTLDWVDNETISFHSDSSTLATTEFTTGSKNTISYPAEIGGITNYDFSKDYSSADTTDGDSSGNQESLPTSIGRSIDLDGNRLEDSAGLRDFGQTWLQSLSDVQGHNATNRFTLSTKVDNDTATQKIFDAWAEYSPISGGHEDQVAWSATLNVTGEVTTST